MSESPSSRIIARRPFDRMFFSADCSMRFTVPRFVTKTRYPSSSLPRPRIIALIFSPFSVWIMFMMFVPRALRPASGML